MEYPKITVVTPVYNGVRYIEQTIRSVIDQNYPNLEYIIIDGGSVDGTVDLIKKYESSLMYWVSEKDAGMYDAICKGFAHSSGEIMTWLNSDDFYYDKSLFVVAQVFQYHPEVKWCCGRGSKTDAEGLMFDIADSNELGWSKYDAYLNQLFWIPQAATFWKSDIYRDIGGLNPGFQLAGDYDLWRKFIHKNPIYIVDSLLATYRVHQGQLSENMEAYLKEVAVSNLDNPSLEGKDLAIFQRYRKLLKWYRRSKRIKCLKSITSMIDSQIEDFISDNKLKPPIIKYNSSLGHF